MEVQQNQQQASLSQAETRQIRLFSALPAQSFTRSLPHGVPADVLLLSNGHTAGVGQDVRSLLFTCYAERGLPNREKIRVTSCHESSEVVGRDVLFLSLLLDGAKQEEEDGRWERLWEIYHSLFTNERTMEMVVKQAEKLLVASSGGLEAWGGSEYGGIVDFVDDKALQEVRRVWEHYQHVASSSSSDRHQDHIAMLLSSMLESKKIRDGDSADVQRELSMSGLRSTAPIPLAGREIVEKGYKSFWEHEPQETANTQQIPNPLLATCLSLPSMGNGQEEEATILHYATNPLLGYHLGTALARLAPESPYLVKSSNYTNMEHYDRVLAALKVQLREWASAFVDMARAGQITIRYALGEPMAVLDGMSTAFKSSAPETISALFNVIDTSTLADKLGFLELIVAARRLLKPSPTSILYTECLRRTSGMSYKEQLEDLMYGDVIVNSLVLGLSPVEYWSNTSMESCIDDVLIHASYDGSPSQLLQNHFKASWRPLGVLHTANPGTMPVAKLIVEVEEVVTLLFNVLDRLARFEVSRSLSPSPPYFENGSRKLLTALVEACQQNVQCDWRKVHNALLDRMRASEQSPLHKDIFAAEIEKLDLSHRAVPDEKIEGIITEKHASIKLAFEQTVLNTLTAHIDIGSETAKVALRDGAQVKVHQATPYIIGVMVGDYLLGEQAIFPVPVLASKTTTRIARKSGYVEIVAQVVDPIGLEEQPDLVFPSTMCQVHDVSGTSRQVPAILNNHSVNLDSLPIISVDNESEAARKANSWLGTLTSQQFSKRERTERELAHEDDTVATSTRLNLKEAIFTMFMLASGLQGGSTGLFALSHPTKGNQMLIFVRALRLDASVGSVVADAAVLPITRELLDTGELETFLLILRELDACVIDVTDEELVMWKKILPEFVESCRTWEHVADCAYARFGLVPLSTNEEAPFLCSCGNGKLPDHFMGGLPEWHVAAQYAVRVAISPVFATPWTEEVMDVEMVRAAGGIDGMDVNRDRCRSCGAFTREGDSDRPNVQKQSLLKCARCKTAMYCSPACQKKDWKKHRAECQPLNKQA